ncbi:MAG: trypsin-like peptidase domain-containing protein [Bacilli bacterium]|nr:trypsin-like peptidase domain-containing protein [Bacilli bacterium]
MNMEVNSYVQNPDGTTQVIVQKKRVSLKLSVVIIIAMVLSVLAGAAGILILLKVNPNFARNSVTNINRSEEVVTVTDKGIADGVQNIYDSVVIVRTYTRDTLVATGTGFIYKQDGDKYYLLTNYHVISGGDNVGVQFTNGEEYKVEVKGGDKYADIAVLVYSGSLELKVAKIGSSDDMRVGDTVFAIGAPLDSEVYSWSVTRGVLSGKDRLVEVSTNNNSTSDWIMKVMQTDAAINSGNSGGPLCNVNGDVIGVTNMKLVNSGVEGMGFAIPVEDAIKFADALVSGEDVSRPYIGITMIDANNRSNASRYGISPRTGVIVENASAGSPAEKAGLTAGDVIIGINDDEIVSVASLRYTLYKYKAGDTITVKFIRSGSEKTTKLTLVANN